MNYLVFIIAFVMMALLLSYLIADLRLKPLNQEVRQALLDASEAHKFADLQLGTIHYRFEGPEGAPVIVLVHGFSTPSYALDDYFEPLMTAGYRVLSFDLYGRGFSDRPHVSYGVDLYAGEIEQLLAHLEIREPVHLLGYSMGGPIVTRFANVHPDQVSGLTLIAPAGLATPEGQGPTILFKPVIGEYLFRILITGYLRNQFSDGFNYAPDPAAFEASFGRQFTYRGLDYALLDTVRAFGRGEFAIDYAGPAAANIPVQAIFSENDSVIPIVSADRLAAINPEADIHRFADGDHSIGYGKVAEIATRLIDFIQD